MAVVAVRTSRTKAEVIDEGPSPVLIRLRGVGLLAVGFHETDGWKAEFRDRHGTHLLIPPRVVGETVTVEVPTAEGEIVAITELMPPDR